MKRAWMAVAAAFVALGMCHAAYAATTVRIATAAPDGSLQVKVMRLMAKKITKETGGEVQFQIFAGGTAGDDLGVIRKMRLGQIDAGGFSGVGIGAILPEARVFEIPFFFESEEQVDCVREKMHDHFAAAFLEQGFVLLGWADVGSVYLFSKKRIGGVSDMSGTKPWVWKGDPVGEATFKAFDLTPTPLQLQDVLTSLQTGLIDTFYNTPALAIALQWNVHATFMIDMPLVNGQGAILVKKEVFDQIAPEHQATVRRIFAEIVPQLVAKTRKENKKSITLMEGQGLERIAVPPAEAEAFRKKGEVVAAALTGPLFPAALLEQVKGHLGSCR